jgi:hypothetical protein
VVVTVAAAIWAVEDISAAARTSRAADSTAVAFMVVDFVEISLAEVGVVVVVGAVVTFSLGTGSRGVDSRGIGSCGVGSSWDPASVAAGAGTVGAGAAANNSLKPLGGRAGSGSAIAGNETPEGRPLGAYTLSGPFSSALPGWSSNRPTHPLIEPAPVFSRTQWRSERR